MLTGQNLSGTLMKPKPLAIQNMFTNILDIMGNSFSWKLKLINPNPLNKKGKMLLLFRTKSTLHKKINYIPHFFLKILETVCLGLSTY